MARVRAVNEPTLRVGVMNPPGQIHRPAEIVVWWNIEEAPSRSRIQKVRDGFARAARPREGIRAGVDLRRHDLVFDWLGAFVSLLVSVVMHTKVVSHLVGDDEGGS